MEEAERDGSDSDRAGLVPDVESVVELLSSSESAEIPGVAVVVRVFLVATNSDTAVAGNAGVDGVDRAEAIFVGLAFLILLERACDSRIDDSLVVSKSLVRAGLEGRGVAAGVGIEAVDGSNDRVGIKSRATVVRVDVGDDVARGRPVVLEG